MGSTSSPSSSSSPTLLGKKIKGIKSFLLSYTTYVVACGCSLVCTFVCRVYNFVQTEEEEEGVVVFFVDKVKLLFC